MNKHTIERIDTLVNIHGTPKLCGAAKPETAPATAPGGGGAATTREEAEGGLAGGTTEGTGLIEVMEVTGGSTTDVVGGAVSVVLVVMVRVVAGAGTGAGGGTVLATHIPPTHELPATQTGPGTTLRQIWPGPTGGKAQKLNPEGKTEHA
ncbi:hypothetical protein BDEG_24886 [Batrachochytrium dendrobatidis JEL423]|uniref:Uncharacterized protein n=1 Tax=Batrachochytrium dendrobatidis (strain JEL423) TaxID=403673 RepID=A0A177WNL0_BATDL|nr:hypothetical protein BDEG_24886 [Batrachochytrium dendrobatidis JEL423]